jgi:hypothetical protein
MKSWHFQTPYIISKETKWGYPAFSAMNFLSGRNRQTPLKPRKIDHISSSSSPDPPVADKAYTWNPKWRSHNQNKSDVFLGKAISPTNTS